MNRKRFSKKLLGSIVPLLVVAGFAAMQPTVTFAQTTAANVQGTSATADKLKLTKDLTKLIGDDGTHVPGLAVVVYKDGKKAYAKALGRRYIDATNPAKDLPMTLDTRFRIASVSKQFTALTIMQLVEAGKVNLDEEAGKYLGFNLRNPNFPNTPITLRMLMSHTSSLRDGKMYAIPPSESVQQFFVPEGKYYEGGAHFAPADQAPGKYFKYSNINYGILGTIIEKVTKERFDLYQKNHILKQLGIKANYSPSEFTAQELKQLGTVYQKQQGGVWAEKGPWVAQVDDPTSKAITQKGMVQINNPDVRDTDAWYSLKNYVPGTNATVFSPQGGLRISANELSHLLEMYLQNGRYKGKQIVKPSLLKEMFTTQWTYNPAVPNGKTYGGTIEAYGLAEQPFFGNGTSRVTKLPNLNFYGHLGEAYGLLSGVLLGPVPKDGFLYISNGEAVAEDDDPRSAGVFSSNYIWEENIMDTICQNMFKNK